MCTRSPRAPTNSSIVAVGRGAVVSVTVDGTAGVVDVEVTTELVEGTAVLVDGSGLPAIVLLPHAVALTSPTARRTMLRWREAGRGVPLQRSAIVSEMRFMDATIDLRGDVPHRTHPLRSVAGRCR
jgi:hypothetical protein